MARAIHWQVPFVSLNGTAYNINIYDDDYSGSVVTLNGAATPIEIEEDSDDDAFLAVRTQSGNIHIVAEQESDLEIITTLAGVNRYVTLTHGSTMVWHGWIQPQTFSQSWGAFPHQFDIPVESCLTELENIDYTPQSDYVTVGTVLNNIFANVPDFNGVTVQNSDFDVLNSHFNDSVFVSEDEDKVARVGVNADLTPPSQKTSCLDVLGYICEYFGLTLREFGGSFCFTYPGSTENNIGGIRVEANVERSAFTEASWTTYGTVGHTDTWSSTSGSRGDCVSGSIFVVTGVSTDNSYYHILIYMCDNDSGNLHGTCLRHIIAKSSVSRTFADSVWNAKLDSSDTWSGTSSTRNGCTSGNYFRVYGTSSDTSTAHVLICKCDNTSGDLHGRGMMHFVLANDGFNFLEINDATTKTLSDVKSVDNTEEYLDGRRFIDITESMSDGASLIDADASHYDDTGSTLKTGIYCDLDETDIAKDYLDQALVKSYQWKTPSSPVAVDHICLFGYDTSLTGLGGNILRVIQAEPIFTETFYNDDAKSGFGILNNTALASTARVKAIEITTARNIHGCEYPNGLKLVGNMECGLTNEGWNSNTVTYVSVKWGNKYLSYPASESTLTDPSWTSSIVYIKLTGSKIHRGYIKTDLGGGTYNYRAITDYMYIPTDSSLEGTITITFYACNDSGYALISSLELTPIGNNKTLFDPCLDLSQNCFRADIGKYSETYSREMLFSSRMHDEQYSDYFMYDEDNAVYAGQPETALLESLTAWFSRSTKQLTIEVDDTDYSPLDTIQVDGENYTIIAATRNFVDNIVKLTLQLNPS